MALKFNGVDIVTNKLNGDDIEKETFNGVDVYVGSNFEYRINSGDWIPFKAEKIHLWQSQYENFITASLTNGSIGNFGATQGQTLSIRRYNSGDRFRTELKEESGFVVDTLISTMITGTVSNGFTTFDFYGGIRIPIDVHSMELTPI